MLFFYHFVVGVQCIPDAITRLRIHLFHLLVKVTDITYATTATGGKFRSTSVTIDGVTCATNLIALNAAS